MDIQKAFEKVMLYGSLTAQQRKNKSRVLLSSVVSMTSQCLTANTNDIYQVNLRLETFLQTNHTEGDTLSLTKPADQINYALKRIQTTEVFIESEIKI